MMNILLGLVVYYYKHYMHTNFEGRMRNRTTLAQHCFTLLAGSRRPSTAPSVSIYGDIHHHPHPHPHHDLSHQSASNRQGLLYSDCAQLLHIMYPLIDDKTVDHVIYQINDHNHPQSHPHPHPQSISTSPSRSESLFTDTSNPLNQYHSSENVPLSPSSTNSHEDHPHPHVETLENLAPLYADEASRPNNPRAYVKIPICGFLSIFEVLRFELSIVHKNRFFGFLNEVYMAAIPKFSWLFGVQKVCSRVCSLPIFRLCIYALLLANVCTLILELESTLISHRTSFVIDLVMAILFMLETILRLLSCGPKKFCSMRGRIGLTMSKWDR